MVQIRLPPPRPPAGNNPRAAHAAHARKTIPGVGPASGAPAVRQQSFVPAGDIDPLIMPWTCLVDHRERQAGWKFQGLHGDSSDAGRLIVVPTKEVTLRTADYTIEGLSPPCLIERKALGDFVSTVTHGHKNFVLEHQRMQEVIAAGGSACVIIEGSYEVLMSELEAGIYPGKVHPNSVRGACASLPCKYNVPWFWAGSRQRAEELAFWVLRKAWERRTVQ